MQYFFNTACHGALFFKLTKPQTNGGLMAEIGISVKVGAPMVPHDVEATVIDPLADMTQAKWDKVPKRERVKIRDNSSLSPQLIGLEGWRVEVVTMEDEQRKFIVGRSSGWRPVHIELLRSDSSGGVPADLEFKSVTKLKRIMTRRA